MNIFLLAGAVSCILHGGYTLCFPTSTAEVPMPDDDPCAVSQRLAVAADDYASHEGEKYPDLTMWFLKSSTEGVRRDCGV